MLIQHVFAQGSTKQHDEPKIRIMKFTQICKDSFTNGLLHSHSECSTVE